MSKNTSRAAGAAVIGSAAAAFCILSAFPALGQGGRPLYAILTGDTEVPGPGHESATGLAEFTLNQGQGRICYTVVSDGLADVVASHIHLAPAGKAGPIVVHIAVDSTGQGQGCADVSKEGFKLIRQNPEAYYYNIHTKLLPAGAIRGQLSEGHADFD